MGQRKYLTPAERLRFFNRARQFDEPTFAFAWLMHSTGCRISEALSLTPAQIDQPSKVIIFECLKKRRKGIFRAVPASRNLLTLLREISIQTPPEERIWTWCRMTAYRRIKSIMELANVQGPQATPKGLRHGFAIAALDVGVPINLVQRWLGHADISTTSIYTQVTGKEERRMARKMWLNDRFHSGY